MISVKLLGGLGNQMFQYALGRSLSLKNDTELFLDLSDLLDRDPSIDHTYRNFELEIFDLGYNIKNTKPGRANLLLRKIFFGKIVKEIGSGFEPEILNLTGNLFLSGFWQSENYFKDIENTLKKDFTFKEKPDPANQQIIDMIEHSESVSVHFRRGDYLSNPQAFAFHGVCTPDYYKNSINYIKKHLIDPHFFVFSDDIHWIKHNVILPDACTFVDINSGMKSYEDMRLMIHCKHNIIANSSFGWWSAWLNKNNEKIVIAPKKWFAATDVDIVPDSWVRIAN